MAKGVSAVLQHVKETKTTHQYKEDGEDRAKHKIGTYYAPKASLKALTGNDEAPEQLKVSLSVPE